VPPYVSSVEDLVLHGPRVLGFASTARIASRYGLDADLTHELLLDAEARGWVQHSSFADRSGWAVTDRGRAEDERRLSAELDRAGAGARDAVAAVHQRFVPLNERFAQTCTRWQIRPSRTDPMALNDHTDWAWDEGVLRTLTTIGAELNELAAGLADRLQRFAGYPDRYSAALSKVDLGQRRWVDAPELDSCHTVWMQLHEDLVATLGIPRGSDG
jgi:hypothetical protein